MPRKKYSADFKSKIVLSILDGSKEFNEVCSEHNLNPNMVSKWKKEFLANAHKVFDKDAELKQAQRKEEGLKKKNDQMLKTIGQRRSSFLTT